MVETSKGEVERLNPHFKWNWRKKKRAAIKEARALRLGNYAFGCRGHPGIVVETNFNPRINTQYKHIFNWDVCIKSIIDGVVESCSVYNCAPEPTTKEYAEKYAAYFKEHGEKKAVMYFAPHAYYAWEKQYYDTTGEFDKFKEGKTLQQYLSLTDDEYAFYIETRDAYLKKVKDAER
jgi:hypothetical protein